MDKEVIMVSVPLESYEDGVSAMARIESLKAFTIKNDYSLSKEDVASILGFELPKKVKREPESVGEF